MKVIRNSAFPLEQLREDLKNHYGIEASEFDPSFDHHYENEPVSTEQRGGEIFFTPSFCTKIALNVKTRFPGDLWLDKLRGWPVVYHGTSADNAGSIIRNGLLINGGQVSPTHGAVYDQACMSRQSTRYSPFWIPASVSHNLARLPQLCPRAKPLGLLKVFVFQLSAGGHPSLRITAALRITGRFVCGPCQDMVRDSVGRPELIPA